MTVRLEMLNFLKVLLHFSSFAGEGCHEQMQYEVDD